MNIRPETPTDFDAIHTLTATAFEPMPFSNGSEPECIRKLRADGDLTLSLVAMDGDSLLGHIAFSPVFIEGQSDWFGLGPVAVWPHLQKQNIGGALIKEGLNRLRKDDAKGCALIGDPNYYKRFGFIGDGSLTYREMPPAYVQWLAFGDNTPTGVLKFSPGLE